MSDLVLRPRIDVPDPVPLRPSHARPDIFYWVFGLVPVMFLILALTAGSPLLAIAFVSLWAFFVFSACMWEFLNPPAYARNHTDLNRG